MFIKKGISSFTSVTPILAQQMATEAPAMATSQARKAMNPVRSGTMNLAMSSRTNLPSST